MFPFEYLVTRFWCACKKCTEHTNILVVVGKCVCNSRKLDLSCGLTCVYQHRLPAALGAIFLPPCLYNTNTEATEKFKFIISTAHSESLFMDLFRPIFHAVLHCIPVSCQLGKWMGCRPSPTVQPTPPAFGKTSKPRIGDNFWVFFLQGCLKSIDSLQLHQWPWLGS